MARKLRPGGPLHAAVAAATLASAVAIAVPSARADGTATPIKHVIIIIGENRTFDHVFATYAPQPGETVNNLLSQGIVNADGTPGTNSPARRKAQRRSPDTYNSAPPVKTPYAAAAAGDDRRRPFRAVATPSRRPSPASPPSGPRRP